MSEALLALIAAVCTAILEYARRKKTRNKRLEKAL